MGLFTKFIQMCRDENDVLGHVALKPLDRAESLQIAALAKKKRTFRDMDSTIAQLEVVANTAPSTSPGDVAMLPENFALLQLMIRDVIFRSFKLESHKTETILLIQNVNALALLLESKPTTFTQLSTTCAQIAKILAAVMGYPPITEYKLTEIARGGLGVVYSIEDIPNFVIKLQAAPGPGEPGEVDSNKKVMAVLGLDPDFRGLTLLTDARLDRRMRISVLDKGVYLPQDTSRVEVVVMHKCSGRDLWHIMTTESTEIEISHLTLVLASIALKVMQVLQRMHKGSLYHKDIKLENIMFCAGEPKLIDFMTATEGFCGTIPYMHRGYVNHMTNGTSYGDYDEVGPEAFPEPLYLLARESHEAQYGPSEVGSTYAEYWKSHNTRVSKEDEDRVLRKNDMYGLGIAIALLMTHLPRQWQLHPKAINVYNDEVFGQLGKISAALVLEADLGGIYVLPERCVTLAAVCEFIDEENDRVHRNSPISQSVRSSLRSRSKKIGDGDGDDDDDDFKHLNLFFDKCRIVAASRTPKQASRTLLGKVVTMGGWTPTKLRRKDAIAVGILKKTKQGRRTRH